MTHISLISRNGEHARNDLNSYSATRNVERDSPHTHSDKRLIDPYKGTNSYEI